MKKNIDNINLCCCYSGEKLAGSPGSRDKSVKEALQKVGVNW
jgi:hypothetical protein